MLAYTRLCSLEDRDVPVCVYVAVCGPKVALTLEDQFFPPPLPSPRVDPLKARLTRGEQHVQRPNIGRDVQSSQVRVLVAVGREAKLAGGDGLKECEASMSCSS